jgi:hypothetical protein
MDSHAIDFSVIDWQSAKGRERALSFIRGIA